MQLRGELLLLLDARENRSPALLELPQIAETLGQVAQLCVVQCAGGLLAITGDERDRTARVQKGDSGADLLGPDPELRGEARFDRLHLGNFGSAVKGGEL